MKRQSEGLAFEVTKRTKTEAVHDQGERSQALLNGLDQISLSKGPATLPDSASDPIARLESLLAHLATQPERFQVLFGKPALDHMRSLLQIVRGGTKHLVAEIVGTAGLDSKVANSIKTEQQLVPDQEAVLPTSSHGDNLWTIQLPRLPEIQDGQYKSLPFLHKSTGYGHKPREKVDYERAEWFGDRKLEGIAAEAVYHRFPNLAPGRLATIKADLVSNETLNEIARAYGFAERLQFNRKDRHLARLMSAADEESITERRNLAGNKGANKIMADVLEAYVGAYYLSHGDNAGDDMQRWLLKVWEPILTKHEDGRTKRLSQLKKVDLKSMGVFGPELAADTTSKRADLPSDAFPGPNSRLEDYDSNSKAELIRRIAPHDVRLAFNEYRAMHFDPASKTNIFHIEVTLNGWGYSNRRIGRGIGKSKIEAGNWASMYALQCNADIVKDCEQKFRERQHREKAARIQKRAQEKLAKAKLVEDRGEASGISQEEVARQARHSERRALRHGIVEAMVKPEHEDGLHEDGLHEGGLHEDGLHEDGLHGPTDPRVSPRRSASRSPSRSKKSSPARASRWGRYRRARPPRSSTRSSTSSRSPVSGATSSPLSPGRPSPARVIPPNSRPRDSESEVPTTAAPASGYPFDSRPYHSSASGPEGGPGNVKDEGPILSLYDRLLTRSKKTPTPPPAEK